jgi:hypothetical protein
VSLQVPEMGFHLGELSGRVVPVDLGFGEVPVWRLNLPAYRSQSSVVAWLWQGDQNVGVVLNAGARSEYLGANHSLGTSAVLPTSKYLLVTRDRIGAAVEGRSESRPVGNNLELHWALQEVEAKAIERQGKAPLYFTRDKDHVFMSPEDEDRLDEMIEARSAGDVIKGGTLPPGIKPESEAMMTSMPEVTGALDRHWKTAWMGTGAEDRITATDGGGSYAAKERAADDVLGEYGPDGEAFVGEPLARLMARATAWSNLHLGDPDMVFVPEIRAGYVVDQLSPQELAQALTTAMGGDHPLINPENWSKEDEASLRSRFGI